MSQHIWRLIFWWPGERTPWFYIFPTKKQCLEEARQMHLGDPQTAPKMTRVSPAHLCGSGEWAIERLESYYHGA